MAPNMGNQTEIKSFTTTDGRRTVFFKAKKKRHIKHMKLLYGIRCSVD